MNVDTVLLLILGATQLTINITTMFLTLPVKRSFRFSVGVLIAFTVVIFGGMVLTRQVDNELAGLAGLAYLPVMLWLFDGPFFQKVFAFFLQYLLTTLLVSFAVAVIGLFMGHDSGAATIVGLMANHESHTVIVFIVVLVLCLFVVYTFLMFRYGRIVFQRLFINGHATEWALYSFGAILSFVAMIIVRGTAASAWQHIFLLLFVLWSFAILCFAIINTHEKAKHRYDAAFARDMISFGRGHYEKMNELYDALRVLRHDYQYHLDTISELLHSGKETEAEKYLTDLQKHLPEDKITTYCPNSVLNALLVNYAERCGRSDVRLVVEISLPKEMVIPNYELCIILGNLLENAYAASVSHHGNREIKLKINTQGAHLAIMVKNNYSGEITEDNGLPRSTKKNGGLGLRSVQAVVARYGGELMTEWDGKTFSAYALMRL